MRGEGRGGEWIRGLDLGLVFTNPVESGECWTCVWIGCMVFEPGFVSTSPDFMGLQCQPSRGPHDRLVQKTVNRASLLGAEGFVTICTAVCQYHYNSSTLSKSDITFTNINIHRTISTHNSELQLVKIHILKNKHITVENPYLPPRDTTLPHYNTVDTDIELCIQHVTNIPDSIFACDVNADSTLSYSHTDDHRGQMISDIISNSEHILKTDTSFMAHPITQ